jgi:hypothetical protein
VRKRSAGDRTPAACGHARGVADEPIAIVNAVRSGSTRVLSVTRKAVAPVSGRTRSSTRSAALFAYTGSSGYVIRPKVGANVNVVASANGSDESRPPAAPWSSCRKSW